MEKAISKLKNRFSKRPFKTREAKTIGVSQRMLNYLSNTDQIKRVGRGLYVLPEFDSEADFQYLDVALKAKSYKEAVISVISALSYWKLTDEVARSFWIALPNNHPVPKETPGLRIIRPRDLKTGVIVREIAGLKVKITDPERSIVDAFKFLDRESAISSLNQYLAQKEDKIHLARLMDMAKKLKAKNLINIMEQVTTAQAQQFPKLNPYNFRQSIQWISKNKRKAP
jgi:predicted transcriptional regulator of viral defense system